MRQLTLYPRNQEKVTKIVGALNLKIPLRDLKSKDTRQLLSLIFSQWLSLSTCIIQAVIDIVPAPSIAQSTRIPKMLYPDLYETTIDPKNKLEEDLFASKSGPDACVSAYVSKMFAVSTKDLPENKKKPVTAEDMRNRAREARAARIAREESTDAESVDTTPIEFAVKPQETETPTEEEVILGFARLYSGTIRTGVAVYAVLPKYNASLGPEHPHNTRHIVAVTVEGLYVMMGRELVAVDSVSAGNIFAIKGLEGKVWRSATLCAPSEVGIGSMPDVAQSKDCLINLGGVNRSAPPIVRVALEPVMPADMQKLVHGLKLLSQSDPCVETFQQQTGEHVILTAGELHLEVCAQLNILFFANLPQRCLKDLRERFARVEIQASKPIVPFRETAVKGTDMNLPKTAGAPRGTIRGASSNNLVTFTIRASPLPPVILDFILENLVTLKKLQQDRKARDSQATQDLADAEEQDGVDVHGDIVRKPTVKPDQFWAALSEKCQEAGNEWENITERIWAFGPQKAGGCVLIDARTSPVSHS